jgi:hypothetical protein
MKLFSRIAACASVGSLLVVLAACRGSSAHFPSLHRAAANTCASDPRPPGYTNPDPDAGRSGECERDADCTKGKNGRCSTPGHAQSMCTYDMCMNDAECGANKVCQCGNGNSCLPANCRTDLDCGGLGCSPTGATSCGNMSGTVGYYCHTKTDDCTENSDCKEGGMCVYQPTVSHWTCSYETCVG